MKRLPDEIITAVETTAKPRDRSVTGYGGKLPTRYMLRVGTRWHRVYAICYSNASTLYVLRSGTPHYLELATESRLEEARERDAQAGAK